jgi:peptidylprolyl isomerase
MMALQKGDCTLINYTAKVKETGEVFDTTLEEIAKQEKLYKEGEIYEPKLIVIGEGWLLKTLDEHLTTMEVNKTATVEIPPEKAFGERDPTKVKRVSLRNLAAKGISPTMGTRVEYDGKMATVRTIGGGRVLLDFNPPLAGKTLVYEVTIQKKLRTVKDKIAALIHRRIPYVEKEKFLFSATSKTKKVVIEMPADAFYLEGIQVAKRGIALDIQRFFPKISTIQFMETYAFPKVESDKQVESERKTTA